MKRGVGSRPGVGKAAVSLTRKQVLVEYDPKIARRQELLGLVEVEKSLGDG